MFGHEEEDRDYEVGVEYGGLEGAIYRAEAAQLAAAEQAYAEQDAEERAAAAWSSGTIDFWAAERVSRVPAHPCPDLEF